MFVIIYNNKACCCNLSTMNVINNRALSLHTVPASWKLMKIQSIPKNLKKSHMQSDFRSIALTPAQVRVMGRFILNHLHDTTNGDDSQFVLRAHRGTSDAILYLTEILVSHMERKNGTYIRCLFVDFSSVFNTLVPDRFAGILKKKRSCGPGCN